MAVIHCTEPISSRFSVRKLANTARPELTVLISGSGSDSTTLMHPPWSRPGRPARDDSVLPFLLERNARETPDRIQLHFEDGENWTCKATLEKTRRSAALLQDHGVKPGDFVLAWMPSGQAMIRTWFALNYLGAVFVPINVDYRGTILRHAIEESNATLMVAHPQLLERLDMLQVETPPESSYRRCRNGRSRPQPTPL